MDPAFQRIDPRTHDLGDGFQVRRVLPSLPLRRIGPFVFFDHFGPVRMAPASGMDVRPHPHVGLATLTYLLDGAIGHHDSLGTRQVIRPGDVNWMTAGRGIVHSERTPDAERAAGQSLHGIQTWLALPKAHEDAEPAFFHHPAATLPELRLHGARIRVVAGDAFGVESPVRVFSRTLYADVTLDAGARLAIPDDHVERAAYAIDGDVSIDDTALPACTMAAFGSGRTVELVARAPSRVLLCGGDPLDGERILWWNFVASDAARIERAKAAWREQRFGRVEGDPEFIPLPER